MDKLKVLNIIKSNLKKKKIVNKKIKLNKLTYWHSWKMSHPTLICFHRFIILLYRGSRLPIYLDQSTNQPLSSQNNKWDGLNFILWRRWNIWCVHPLNILLTRVQWQKGDKTIFFVHLHQIWQRHAFYTQNLPISLDSNQIFSNLSFFFSPPVFHSLFI